VCRVGGRLYMMNQLIDSVVAKNVYDEAKDVANENKTRSWFVEVADWLLSLTSRFFIGYFY